MTTTTGHKINPNAANIPKLDEVLMSVPTTHRHDCQQRLTSSSKRTTTTMINNFDQSLDNNTSVLHQSKIHHATRSTKPKDNRITNISKPGSESEEVYTAPSNNDGVRISPKQRLRQEMGDYIRNDNIEEESTGIRNIMSKNKTPVERLHRLSAPLNNSAIRLQQQQGMGDHYLANTKQQKIRSKTKSHRLTDLDMTSDERTTYRWRITMYILTILALTFVIYRFLLATWPKPKKTFTEQLIDDLSAFFTP